MNTTPTAKSRKDQAEQRREQLMRKVRQILLETKHAYPKQTAICPVTGVSHETQCAAWQNMYYSHKPTARAWVKFAAAVPSELAAHIQADYWSAISAQLDADYARDEMKAEKIDRFIDREIRKSMSPSERQLDVESKTNKHARANYGLLANLLADDRFELMREEAVRASKVEDATLESICERVAGVEASFLSFIAKLAGKVDRPIVSARMQGMIWTGCTITLECVGEKQVWRTDQIINRSCLGTVFNQWPTRRIQ